MNRYLLDTSALIALREDEPGADFVETILRQSQQSKAEVFFSFMTGMEIFYTAWRALGKGEALRLYLEIRMLPLRRIDLTERLLLTAGEIKANYPLSVADSWIAATALVQEATLVHKDPEFEPLKDRISLKSLPYK